MTIPELKSRLNLLDVAAHLGIEIDPRTNRAHCPFHADKTPSLQFSEAKQICTCFSGNCEAGTMDVISLTEKKLGVSTHEAIMYLKELVGQGSGIKVQRTELSVEAESPDYAAAFKVMQSSLLSSSTGRKYAESRALDWKKLGLLQKQPLSLPAGLSDFWLARQCRKRGESVRAQYPRQRQRQALLHGQPEGPLPWIP